MYKLFVWMLLILILFLSGCWDKVEIEERGFVVAMGIDTVSEKEKEQQTKPTFLITQQFIIPAGNVEEGSVEGGENSAYFNLYAEAETLFEASRQLATRTSRTPYFRHLQLLIISEEVVQSVDLKRILDFATREIDIRTGTLIMIADGEARKVLEIEPPNEKVSAMYTLSVARNHFKNARMLKEISIGEVQRKLLNEKSFVIPRVVGRNEEVRIAGSAIIKGHTDQMISFLNEEETMGVNFLTGESEGGLIKFHMEDDIVLYDIGGMKSTVEADVSNKENIKFNITIEMEGMIKESLVDTEYEDEEDLEKTEKEVERRIKDIAEKAIEKTQEELKVDVLELGEYLRQNYHEVWQEIKDNWEQGENYFSQSEINVNASIDIRNTGATH